MKMNLKMLTLVTFTVIVSCGEKNNNPKQPIEEITRYADGKIRERRTIATGDSVDSYYERFFPSGTLEAKFSVKNGLQHGYYREFYENGKMNFEGVLIAGRRKGYFKYYDSNGNLDKVINFINYRDSSVAMPNEIIRVGANGDTLFNQSYFYNFYSNGDTFKNGIGKYRFIVVPRGSMFKYFYIAIGDFDEKFNQVNPEKIEMTEIKNGEIRLSPAEQKLGKNFVRGYILCTENPLHPDGKWDGRAIKMFFSKNYYVVP